MNKKELLELRLLGHTYQSIAKQAGFSRQRVQQLLSPPVGIRNLIVRKAGGKCQDCNIIIGFSGHIHHEPAKNEEDYSDIDHLTLLCPSCHMRRHHPITIKKPETRSMLDQAHSPKAKRKAVAPKTFANQTCPRCEHTWQPRVKNPVACPKCNHRLDSPYKLRLAG